MSGCSTGGGCQESEPFALQVLGDSMAPEFPNGCIIVSEPNAVVEDGCYVIAKHNDEFIFRQLHIDENANKWTLSALDENEPMLEITGPDDIRARVVQRTTGRRSSRKFYV